MALGINKKSFIPNKCIANKEGKKINQGHEQYIEKITKELENLQSKEKVKQSTSSLNKLRKKINQKNLLIADIHYQYAIHLNELRTYYFYCFEEANEIDKLKYLKKAKKYSAVLLKQFKKAQEKYQLANDPLKPESLEFIAVCKNYDDEIKALIEKDTSSHKKRKAEEPAINIALPNEEHELEINHSLDINDQEPKLKPKISKFKKPKYSKSGLEQWGLFNPINIQTDFSQITSFSLSSSSLTTTPSSCRSSINVNSELDKFNNKF